MKDLNEAKKRELIDKAKKGRLYAPTNRDKGKNRYERRLHSKISNSVREYNSIDMNRLFKDGVLTVLINVQGETDKYQVGISYGSFLALLQKQLEKQNGVFDLKVVYRALVDGFNTDNVYIKCTCPDWRYRMGFYANINDFSLDDPKEERPSRITNPDDDLGSGCKHVCLVLNNQSQIMKVASVIKNYVEYMEKHQKRLYQQIIYPAIYQKDWDDQEFLPQDLETDSDTIDVANKQAREKGQWKKGNKYRIEKGWNQKSDDEEEDEQTSLFDDDRSSSNKPYFGKELDNIDEEEL